MMYAIKVFDKLASSRIKRFVAQEEDTFVDETGTICNYVNGKYTLHKIYVTDQAQISGATLKYLQKMAQNGDLAVVVKVDPADIIGYGSIISNVAYCTKYKILSPDEIIRLLNVTMFDIPNYSLYKMIYLLNIHQAITIT